MLAVVLLSEPSPSPQLLYVVQCMMTKQKYYFYYCGYLKYAEKLQRGL